MSVGLAIPSIPPRVALLRRALGSVCAQELLPNHVSVSVDHWKLGATENRNLAWRALPWTDWVAFLDDDDELQPEHLRVLVQCAEATGADLVYPWFTVRGGLDPMPGHFGRPWDPAEPRQTTITVLWRRDALEAVGGFSDWDDGTETAPDGNRAGEDFRAVCRLNEIGGKIVHLPQRTWIWNHHGHNTSGLASRW